MFRCARWAVAFAALVATAACATSAPTSTRTVAGGLPSAAASTAQPLAPASVRAPSAPAVVAPDSARLAEITAALQEAHQRMVSRALPIAPDDEARWNAWIAAQWTASGKTIDHDQTVVVVNRNPLVQRIAVLIAHPSGAWTLIGQSPTSTGRTGSKDHFISPVGVFDHDASIIDYRALGTKNENGIRGIGAKGSRVWDFGWQSAQTGWLKTPEMRTIRFELHATDPDLLEQRLGHPASAGCIRISAGLNKFLDHYAVLDAVPEQLAPTSRAWSALLPTGGAPLLPGRYMIVVDDPLSAPAAPVARAAAMPPSAPVAPVAPSGIAPEVIR